MNPTDILATMGTLFFIGCLIGVSIQMVRGGYVGDFTPEYPSGYCCDDYEYNDMCEECREKTDEQAVIRTWPIGKIYDREKDRDTTFDDNFYIEHEDYCLVLWATSVEEIECTCAPLTRERKMEEKS